MMGVAGGVKSCLSGCSPEPEIPSSPTRAHVIEAYAKNWRQLRRPP